MQLLHFHRFSDHLLTSGQPQADEWQYISDEGVSVVINLSNYGDEDAPVNEGEEVVGAGMTYIHLPVCFDNPTVEDLRRFIRLMKALEGETVLIHCAMNIRVSVFIYKYLTLYKNWDKEAATSPILARWLPQMDDSWGEIMALTKRKIGA